MTLKAPFSIISLTLLALFLSACSDSDNTISQEVTATAYTLSEAETKKGCLLYTSPSPRDS